MRAIPVFIGVHIHRHGTHISVHATMDKAIKAKAKTARDWWEERIDQTSPEEHDHLSDSEVIQAYFDGNEDESYEIEETTLDI